METGLGMETAKITPSSASSFVKNLNSDSDQLSAIETLTARKDAIELKHPGGIVSTSVEAEADDADSARRWSLKKKCAVACFVLLSGFVA